MGKSRYKKKIVPKPSELDVASRLIWCFLESIVIFGAIWAFLPSSLFENTGGVITPIVMVIAAAVTAAAMFWGRFSLLFILGAIALIGLVFCAPWAEGSNNRQKRNR
jgi:hypothetical protein